MSQPPMNQPQDKTVFDPAPPASRFLAWFALLIAAAAAIFYNYTLLASPMGELVGGKAVIAGFSVASVAAVVFTLLEVFHGLFFLEARGVTHLFPVIHALPAAGRQGLGYFFAFLLVCFAGVQAGLVWMAHVLAERAATEAYGSTGQAFPAVDMAVAFLLPFVLILAGLSLDRVLRALGGRPT